MNARESLGRSPHYLVASLCSGLAAANAVRATSLMVTLLGVAFLLCAVALVGGTRVAVMAALLGLAGWWWGSVRLEAVDRSALLPEVGRAERSIVVVTGPTRRGRFELELPGRMLRFGRRPVDEPVELELPLGRAPPQGSVLEALGEVVRPPGPRHGFDKRTWLRRRGIHVLFRVDRWRTVGRRGGLGGVGDRLRASLGRSVALGLHGERRAVVVGVILGDDQDLSPELRQRFRASGLYHLLAVSGQNVALVAGAVLSVVWLLGLPRWLGELGALAGMASYVLAVGAQPSVVRAGVAGALGSIAWLAARQRDRWYFFLLGALVLLAWNPYTLLDAGFQLSFAAVAAIFTLVPRIRHVLEGYPLPGGLRDVVAVSSACGAATAPVAWVQFHAVSLVTVPANALAAPAVVPLLGLALASAALAPMAPGAASACAWLNGWCAAYLAGCARLMGAVPGAQVRSGKAAAFVATGALVVGAYAWRRWRKT